jgi:hypothetical protein
MNDRGIKSAMSVFAVLAIACIGALAYTASHLDDISRPAGLGIIGASAILAAWNLIAMGRSRGSSLQESSLATIFSVIVVTTLIGIAAATAAGVGPFSEAGDDPAPSGNNTPGPGAEATPTPTPIGVDVVQIRQDRSMRSTIDSVCVTAGEEILVDMSIRNLGNSTLRVTAFRHLPHDAAVQSPLADPAHPCHNGIQPGEVCLFRHLSQTHVELRTRGVDRETYLVVYGEDAMGEEYGVTFTLPPADEMPECD